MAIDYNQIYEKALYNKENGIPVVDTIKSFLGHRNSGNFYKALNKNQKNNLKKANGLSENQKQEFKRMYIEEGYTMSQLRDKYRIRTKTAIDHVNSFSSENSRSLKNHNRKLTKYQVIKILIERMRYGTLQRELAKKYGVTDSLISAICNGHHWKHIFQGVKKKYNDEILSLRTDVAERRFN